MDSSQIRYERLANILSGDHMDEGEVNGASENGGVAAEGWDEEIADVGASEGFCIECEGMSSCLSLFSKS